MMDEILYDAIVIGCGPAGTAEELRSELVVEPAEIVRPKKRPSNPESEGLFAVHQSYLYPAVT